MEVMRDGHPVAPSAGLAQIRAHCLDEVRALPAALHDLQPGAAAVPVQISDALRALATQLDAKVR